MTTTAGIQPGSPSSPAHLSNIAKETPTFTSNGLLGITGILNGDGDTPSSTAMTIGLNFASNGLLGDHAPTGNSEEPSSLLANPQMSAFTSNGLLDCTSSVATNQGHDTTYQDSSSNAQLETSHPFVGNGLLSGIPEDGGLRPSSTSLSNSQDLDDSPSVTDALGISTVPHHIPNRTITLPRTSLRATTFDGKTIYLKRKPKIISTSTGANVVKLCPCLFIIWTEWDVAVSDSSTHGQSSRRTNSQTHGSTVQCYRNQLTENVSTSFAFPFSNLAQCYRRDQLSRHEASDTPVASTSKAVDDVLWVDRYRPRKFTDLLGNERVAREAMSWVKQWDYCVFGISKGKKRARDDDENVDPQDELRRPKEKILLLSGPPGLGKTTLAHVVARHAGYEVMEINASDARSGSIVDDRIRPALESGYAVGSTKPVLLVIDEIDGATGAGDNTNTFIHKLVQLILAKPRKNERAGRNRDAQNQNKRTIRRPIICICNDHNASSLAKLRPHAYQIRFNRPADVHLVKRLKEICAIEGLKADSRALSTLVSVAKGDLRGCLNTLQFVKTRNEDVTESVIRKATSGMKEEDSSVQSVLNNLFTPLSKKRVKELGLTDEEEARYVARLSREIDNSGRESTIASGCFGHYATLRRHDANLTRQEQAMEWLTTYDRFSSAMFSDGDFSLNQYLPYTLVPFFPLFQEKGGERVERNQADWEHLQVTRSNEEILKSLARCLRSTAVRYGGDYRHLMNTPILQTEFVPYLNRIISPPLRPVNSQVIRAQEKALMTRLVDIMSTLELRFVQEKADDGQLTASDIAVSRYAVRQLVSAEIDAKLIARDTDVIEKGKRGKHDFFGKSRPSASETDGTLAEASSSPSKRAKTIDTRDIADMPPTDFFGRPITVASAGTTKAAVRRNVEKKYKVTYRFLEGNSAAVRKPVKVNMFL
ncbi:hypothetical protein CVT26_010493 [Gymnopilus dilepis]|uniref:AAA+ ATPase domain-containing protein n=1 Tax=Gymnopilus dilepis TaxID=231916 RepID=A0A409W549_9AGAR|nr:hypothetical protein CVT26_010493 [Gymnopilus dilepis]